MASNGLVVCVLVCMIVMLMRSSLALSRRSKLVQASLAGHSAAQTLPSNEDRVFPSPDEDEDEGSIHSVESGSESSPEQESIPSVDPVDVGRISEDEEELSWNFEFVHPPLPLPNEEETTADLTDITWGSMNARPVSSTEIDTNLENDDLSLHFPSSDDV